MKLLAVTILSVLGASAAHAATVLYDNGSLAVPQGEVYHWNYNYSQSSTNYDNFTLGEAALIETITWSGFEEIGDTYTRSYFTIVEGADPVTGMVVYDGNAVADRTANGVSLQPRFKLTGFDYQITGLSIPINANTTYWLGLSNDTALSSVTAVSTGSLLGGGSWQHFFSAWSYHSDDESPFALDGTVVPEPAVMPLLVGGLCILARRRRRSVSSHRS